MASFSFSSCLCLFLFLPRPFVKLCLIPIQFLLTLPSLYLSFVLASTLPLNLLPSKTKSYEVRYFISIRQYLFLANCMSCSRQFFPSFHWPPYIENSWNCNDWLDFWRSFRFRFNFSASFSAINKSCRTYSDLSYDGLISQLAVIFGQVFSEQTLHRTLRYSFRIVNPLSMYLRLERNISG